MAGQRAGCSVLAQLARHCDAGVVRRSLAVAAVVGPTLVFINQGPAIAAGGVLDLGRALLTALVPFAVSCLSGSLAGRRGAAQIRTRERAMAERLTPLVQVVEQVHRNALPVNATASARYDETSALLKRVKEVLAEVQGGAPLVRGALDAATDVQRQFELVLHTEAELRTEIAANAVTANSVSVAVGVTQERLLTIANLAVEIEWIGQQTTLLALNAAVVAASAGPEGRRFATIAEAIHELAGRTGAQARTVRMTAANLREAAAQMADESAQLADGMRRLLACSERASSAVESAAGSMVRSSQGTQAGLRDPSRRVNRP